jgi:phosphoserine aminotransferase
MSDVNGTGQSAMEMSHRSGDFKPIIEKAEALLRELMDIPPNYKILFLQGGASLQFAMVPLNLAGSESGAPEQSASYVDTGVWAKRAIDEASKYVNVRVRGSSRDKNYASIPESPPPEPGDAYYHITLNNTIAGTKWAALPETGAVPLAADISSCILSEPLDISRFGLVYAGAQKNLGPAGTTVVIIREDLIGKAPARTPAMLRYDIHASEGSLYNTPPCYGVYIIGLVLEWIKGMGGAGAMGALNREKADLLYACLENSKLFYAPVEKNSRSITNIVFVPKTKDPEARAELETRFVREAAARGLVNLAGHRLVGGMRASVYNAMPIEGVKALIQFIEHFEKEAARV